MAPSIQYPQVRKEEITETFFGHKISDPYRYLENPDSEETKQFIDNQNLISKPFLEENEFWGKINKKLTDLWNFEKYNVAYKRGKRYFYSYNTGLQNQNVIYYQESLDGERKVFLDPNELSSDGTVALQSLHFTKDGSLLAYGLSESGSDWVKIKFRDVEKNEDFPETLEHSKFFTPTWTHDNKGVFYGKFLPQGTADGCETNANENQKVYYHRIGTSQDSDVLVAEFPEEPNWRFSAEVSDCGHYLLFYVMYGCNDHLIYFADLRKTPEITGKLEFTKVVTEFKNDYDYITNNESIFYFRTNKGAPNYHIIAIDFENYEESNWKTLVPEHPKNVLDWAYCVHKNKMILHYMIDVKSSLQVYSLDTGKFEFEFKLDYGCIQGFSGERDSSEIFFQFVSFLIPGTIYHYDFNSTDSEPKIFKDVTIAGFNRKNYKVDQIFYNSTDGEKIPMFIIKKNENEITPRPTLVSGYGGFNISIQPCFSITLLAFIDLFDGVLCYPNIRGGGEYGERWHNGGRLLNKQNVFNDFQSAAKYLIDNNYTKKELLAIQGGSNGGLLVGACINQRPDLFGAAIAQVGVFDMLRFHKFTIGSAWISDFGSPDEEKHFLNLLKYSPLHNTHTPENPNQEYPATLILTADHDDRVSPLHSLKFSATLQNSIRNSPFQKNPILLRVYTKSGHGFGKPVKKKIEEATDILTFLYKTLDIKVDLP
ncbi:hypothetical protein PVAND_004499 [Polypedilum vanderplanki]|uniref:Prolyl endopeptidase n=1 Tax=Polypedilum vanderplanki TaxID=319348 RepID=A0A9J6BX57_POLVA|nr:hypothetical protein PVAND_004499 [Polypedilum vanderplanki]